MSPSTMGDAESDAQGAGVDTWPAMPVETEIYLLPDGRIVVADLPMELADLLAALGQVEPCGVPTNEIKQDEWREVD